MRFRIPPRQELLRLDDAADGPVRAPGALALGLIQTARYTSNRMSGALVLSRRRRLARRRTSMVRASRRLGERRVSEGLRHAIRAASFVAVVEVRFPDFVLRVTIELRM